MWYWNYESLYYKGFLGFYYGIFVLLVLWLFKKLSKNPKKFEE